MKTPISLKTYCDQHGQQRASEIVGVSQSRISQILSESDKEVFITEDDGKLDWYLIKRPNPKSAA